MSIRMSAHTANVNTVHNMNTHMMHMHMHMLIRPDGIAPGGSGAVNCCLIRCCSQVGCLEVYLAQGHPSAQLVVDRPSVEIAAPTSILRLSPDSR